MDREFLVTFEYDKIVPVSLVVAEEQVFAVCGVDFLPILECKLDCGKRRMVVSLVADAVFLKKSMYFFYLFVSHDDLFESQDKNTKFLINFV